MLKYSGNAVTTSRLAPAKSVVRVCFAIVRHLPENGLCIVTDEMASEDVGRSGGSDRHSTLDRCGRCDGRRQGRYLKSQEIVDRRQRRQSGRNENVVEVRTISSNRHCWRCHESRDRRGREPNGQREKPS